MLLMQLTEGSAIPIVIGAGNCCSSFLEVSVDLSVIKEEGRVDVFIIGGDLWVYTFIFNYNGRYSKILPCSKKRAKKIPTGY